MVLFLVQFNGHLRTPEACARSLVPLKAILHKLVWGENELHASMHVIVRVYEYVYVCWCVEGAHTCVIVVSMCCQATMQNHGS